MRKHPPGRFAAPARAGGCVQKVPPEPPSQRKIIVFTSLAIAPLAHVGGAAGFPFWPLFVISHVFWFVVIVLLIVFVIRARRRRFANWGAGGHFGPWGNTAARSAESTLAERFAQGDIDEKEYRARLEVLRANNGPQQQA
jgi:putative membrane protein